MSTPQHLQLPDGVSLHLMRTARGEFAVLEAPAPPMSPHRGSAVLVPGFTGSKEDFIEIPHRLAAAGLRVIALDQRGQFQTPGPDDASAYSLEALGADLLAVTAELPRPVHLVGHSFGGLVVRAAALLDPAATDSVTLLCSGPGPISVPRERDRLQSLLAALEHLTPEQIWAFIDATAQEAGEYVDVAAEVREFLGRRFASSAAAGLAAMATALLHTPDRVEDLARTGLPVLVTHGVADYIWLPAEQQAMAQRLGARYVVIEDAAHSPAVQQPGRTARTLLEFWAEI